MSHWNKVGIVAVAAALSCAVVAAPAPAFANDGRNAALFGGLAAGALVGGAIANSGRGYYREAPAYQPYYPAYEAAPVYPDYPVYRSAPAYSEYEVYAPRPCYVRRQPIYNQWGDFAGYRRVRVCR